MTAAILVLIALLGFVWLYRARSARRWKAALDAYAERGIARDRSFRMKFGRST
jgi:hypothetical protein